MNRWLTAWQLAKDVILTGAGVTLIITQVFSTRPSDVLLVTGLALTVPSVAGHTAQLLAGRPGGEHPGDGRSSPPSDAPGPPPPPSPGPPPSPPSPSSLLSSAPASSGTD